METTWMPYFFPKFSSANVLPTHADSPGISKSVRCRSRDSRRPAYSGFFSPIYSARMSRYRRFWKNVLSIMMDCFFNWRESIIRVTSSTATPNTRPTDILNKPAITNMTNETPSSRRSTMVATNGARFPRLSFHKVTNSSEWFFLIMMARRNGAIHRMMIKAANREPHTPGRLSCTKGTRKRNAKAITATQMMEYTTVILTSANISFFHRLSWFMVCEPEA